MGTICKHLKDAAEAVKGVAVQQYVRNTSVRRRTGQYPPVFVLPQKCRLYEPGAQDRGIEPGRKLRNRHDGDPGDQDNGVQRKRNGNGNAGGQFPPAFSVSSSSV